MSSLDESGWGAPSDTLPENGQTAAESHISPDSTEPPLQYAALWVESQPSSNTVSLQQLGRILARAVDVPAESAALILEQSCSQSQQQRVGEAQFHRALALAAAVQQNPSFDVGAEPADGPLQMLEVTLSAQPSVAVDDEPVPDYNPTVPPTISVELMSKSEGSFLSKHAVYTVSGEFQKKPFRVLRRFRDFAWLLESLSVKYPFRALPVLPPKRLVMNGTYLTGASQDAFLQRRAEGLTRFLNLLVAHPVLAKEPLVRTFLYAESQFVRVKNHLSADTELSSKIASPLFISQWSAERLTTWNRIEGATQEFLQQTTSVCLVLERTRARTLAARDDAEILGRNCLALSRSLYSAYPSQQDDLAAIQASLESVAQYSESSKATYTEGSAALATGPLEELRMYRDMLHSVLDLFKRYRSQGGNSIPELEKKIGSNQRKLAALATKEEARDEDMHKLRTAIQAAQSSIRDQTNRDWLIKKTMSEELEMVQAMQYQISRILRALVSTFDATASHQAELASQLADAAGTAPLKL